MQSGSKLIRLDGSKHRTPKKFLRFVSTLEGLDFVDSADPGEFTTKKHYVPGYQFKVQHYNSTTRQARLQVRRAQDIQVIYVSLPPEKEQDLREFVSSYRQ